jgi:hypothetical protein
MSLGVYDDKKGITIPIYDNKIVFSPTPRPKKRAGRNRYSLKTECVLSMLNYCNENYITAFDFNYNSYFEIGAYRLNLNIRQIIAHTINTCVDYDFRKDESAVEMFINAVNKNEGLDDIKIPDDDKDNEFNNLVKALQAQYNERQILFLIYITFIDKDNPHETEEALNKFYRSFTNEQFIPFINEELNYNLKIAFEDSGYLTFSKDIIELVNKDTKEVISDGTDYVKIPIYNIVDFKFAIDNVPRLFISFDIDNRDKKMYKVNTGFNRTPLKKYEKISKENPKYLELAHVNIVYYNNRIQVTITSSEDDWNHYESFQIINEKRQTLLPKE